MISIGIINGCFRSHEDKKDTQKEKRNNQDQYDYQQNIVVFSGTVNIKYCVTKVAEKQCANKTNDKSETENNDFLHDIVLKQGSKEC